MHFSMHFHTHFLHQLRIFQCIFDKAKCKGCCYNNCDICTNKNTVVGITFGVVYSLELGSANHGVDSGQKHTVSSTQTFSIVNLFIHLLIQFNFFFGGVGVGDIMHLTRSQNDPNCPGTN